MSLCKKQYDNFIWGLKYRPTTIDDIVLPDRFKTHFKKIVEEKQIPNMLLSGPRGCGKTTSAFCIADQVGCDTKYINMSKDNSIDMIRHEIARFANTMSFNEGKKLVIGDECDRLSIQAIDALKGDLEQYGKNCTFIFTSNRKEKLADHPFMSRLQEFDFEFSKKETVKMQTDFYKMICMILRKEKVEFDKKAIGYIIKQIWPDMRKVLNELQKYSAQFDKKITKDIINLISITSDSITMLFDAIKDKDFRFCREYISELTINPAELYSVLFKNILTYVAKESFPLAINILDEEQYRISFSLNKEIPMVNTLMRLMDCNWK